MIFGNNESFAIDEKCWLVWNSEEGSISFERISEAIGNVQPVFWPGGIQKNRSPR